MWVRLRLLQKVKAFAGRRCEDKGSFSRGDAVVIRAPDDREIGRGLSGYSASEAKAIKGLKSGVIESVLGYTGRAALIHRNDMAD